MALICDCNAGLGNTGQPNCVPVHELVKQWIVVPTFDNTGVKNSITIAGLTFDQTFLDARINDADASKRWFPLPLHENSTNERAETVFETSAGGRKRRIKQGIRSMFFELWDSSPEFLGKLQTQYCTWTSVYGVTVDGSLLGMLSSDGTKLLPIRLDKNSMDDNWVFATDTVGTKTTVAVDWYETEFDKNLKLLSANDITAELLGVGGLVDVTAVFSSISTTGATVTLTTPYGTVLDPIMVSGLLLADSVLFNVTDTAAVTKLTWVEGADGVYAFTFAAQTSADVLRLTITKSGYDFSAVTTNTFIIP